VRLVSFSLQRYRSIIKAENLRFGDLTILIGPNNEGKSNILHGLVAGMRVLERAARTPVERGRLRATAASFADDYEWDRDFPLQLREKMPDGATLFDFEFEFTPAELADFKKEVGSQLTKSLPIRLFLRPRGAEFRVIKKGAGSPKLTEKRDQITRFLGSRLQLQYVQSVRTAQRALRVVDEMVDRELQSLETTPDYQRVVADLAELQRPVLENLSVTIREMLATFLPDVRGVDVTISVEDRYGALRRSSRMVVDDGTPTELSLKGDGVQSLAAISLIRHVSAQVAKDRELILAIEEPEAHLHPEAIHKLRAVLSEIAAKQQVVLTTHSPLLVNRGDVRANILVQNSKALPAKSIKEIRTVLGVRTSDNLESARVVLVVEGDSDRTTVEALLKDRSTSLRRAIEEGELVIETMGGTSNLGYKLSHLRETLCLPYVFMDSDAAGVDATNRAIAAGLLDPPDYTIATCPGLNEAELEDLLDLASYREVIQSRWSVNINTPTFRNGKAKWTSRIAATFKAQGKVWNVQTEKRVKGDIAKAVASSPGTALHPNRTASFDALVRALEERIARYTGD
jgi:hypothetical protein